MLLCHMQGKFTELSQFEGYLVNTVKLSESEHHNTGVDKVYRTFVVLPGRTAVKIPLNATCPPWHRGIIDPRLNSPPTPLFFDEHEQ